MHSFSERTKLLIDKDVLKGMNRAKIAIFGLGGVGSYALEALARLGVANFLLIDGDKIEITNINRQLLALNSTIGKNKVDVAKKRVLDINPLAKVEIIDTFYKDQEYSSINYCNYVIDAMDTVSSKLNLIEKCKNQKIPIISCMGTANRLDPTKFLISDIYSTSACPLCKVVRHELKRRKVECLDVIYSTEIPAKTHRGKNLGSISFVPATAGLLLAYFVFRNISACHVLYST